MAGGTTAAAATDGLHVHILIAQDFHQGLTSFGLDDVLLSGAVDDVNFGHGVSGFDEAYAARIAGGPSEQGILRLWPFWAQGSGSRARARPQGGRPSCYGTKSRQAAIAMI